VARNSWLIANFNSSTQVSYKWLNLVQEQDMDEGKYLTLPKVDHLHLHHHHCQNAKPFTHMMLRTLMNSRLVLEISLI
jgi:hypothetical protein